MICVNTLRAIDIQYCAQHMCRGMPNGYTISHAARLCEAYVLRYAWMDIQYRAQCAYARPMCYGMPEWVCLITWSVCIVVCTDRYPIFRVMHLCRAYKLQYVRIIIAIILLLYVVYSCKAYILRWIKYTLLHKTHPCVAYALRYARTGITARHSIM